MIPAVFASGFIRKTALSLAVFGLFETVLFSTWATMEFHRMQNRSIAPNHFEKAEFSEQSKIVQQWTTSRMQPSDDVCRLFTQLCQTPHPVLHDQGQTDKLYDVVEQPLNYYYNDAAVNSFRQTYLQKRTAWLGNNVIYDSCNVENGFMYQMNHILNAFLLALDAPGTLPFHVAHTGWFYGPLSYYFEDFSAKSRRPIFTELSSNSNLRATNISFREFLNAPFRNSSYVVSSLSAANWKLMTAHIQNQTDRDGLCTTLTKKRLLAKALWNPTTPIRRLIDAVRTYFRRTTGSERFVGIHVRGGDKVATKQMAAIPMRSYFDLVRNVSQLVFPANTERKAIFIISDETTTENTFKQHFTPPEWHVISWNDAVKEKFAQFILQPQPGYDLLKFRELPLGEIQRQTSAFVAMATVLARASRIVCTLSSNVCRFVALLRNDYCASTIHSLDWPAWTPL